MSHSTEHPNLPHFIAITGQEGSGKDSLGHFLAQAGYMHVSAGDVLRERARALGHVDPIPRAVLSQVGDEFKREFGPSPITESTLEKYRNVQNEFSAGVVISGLRRAGELKAYKSYGAVSIWIDADEDRRFYNIGNRSRGDQQAREAFTKRSKEEYFGTTQGGEEGVNLQAIEALADCRVVNDGTLEELYENAVNALAQFAH